MKKILITGEKSYVGKNFKKWLEGFPDLYSVHSISVRDESWENRNFSEFDVVFHVAGIAHLKEKSIDAKLYYKVNRDLAFEVARKAKLEGVKQFIFVSSMSVYGLESGVIDKGSPLNPKSNYGKSKLQAEELISTLEDSIFKVAIIRPPMIYGAECKGNYTRLSKLALKTPIFPDINNKRSMIFISNLCEFVRLLIDDTKRGIFHPQNEEYVCTAEMVELIAKFNGRHIIMTKLFNNLLRLIKVNTVNKVFGDLVYAKQIDDYRNKNTVCDFETSIHLTEKKI